MTVMWCVPLSRECGVVEASCADDPSKMIQDVRGEGMALTSSREFAMTTPEQRGVRSYHNHSRELTTGNFEIGSIVPAQ